MNTSVINRRFSHDLPKCGRKFTGICVSACIGNFQYRHRGVDELCCGQLHFLDAHIRIDGNPIDTFKNVSQMSLR